MTILCRFVIIIIIIVIIITIITTIIIIITTTTIIIIIIIIICNYAVSLFLSNIFSSADYFKCFKIIEYNISFTPKTMIH